ncbi:tetratricopeptide repeat protein [Polaribacter dokdonensis]|uniref:Tetratricopeptide repeat protein n=1 Tax=Polaribacter dokdonensis DSW-5 TaxID=1300348 RepID=A0A0N0CFI7_9FLAO|nr:tetratricopeptide repeat protein [Polaribacter dokdonensis]KOY51950.1 Tetratricopeptide repeat protein [Polaribacter dokdonensis DSW-5]SED99173.1 Tetratricopeptide repeat-containing protein [Polaribacter dokdonensis DSW-5]
MIFLKALFSNLKINTTNFSHHIQIVGVLLSFFFYNCGYSQNIDSLQTVYSQTSIDEERNAVLMQIGAFYANKNLDSSTIYYSKVLEFATTSKNDSLVAAVNLNIANNFLKKGQLDISMSYQLKALKIHETTNNVVGIVRTLNNISLIYFQQSKFDKALFNYTKILDLIDKNPTKITTENKSKYKGIIYNNIGIIYDNQSKFNEALEYFTKGLTYSNEANDNQNLASLYSNTGLLYSKMEEYSLSEVYLKQALRIRIEENNTYGKCKSYLHLGTLYHNLNKSDLSKTNLLLGLKECEKAKSTIAEARILFELSSLSAANEKFKEAYQYQSNYLILNDSLTNSETARKITELEMKFNFDKEKEKAKIQQQKKQHMFLIVGIILVLVIIVIVVLYLLLKAKSRNQALEKTKVDLQNKELSLRKQTLELELESRSKELTTNVMYLIKNNELIGEISKRLIDLKKLMKRENQQQIQKIIMDLQTAKDNDVWDEFEVRFNQVYNDFYERLNQKFPNLTINEKKICAFLKLNMTSKEICTLTRQSPNSLNVARTRLRKKLGLNNTSENLVSFLENI